MADKRMPNGTEAKAFKTTVLEAAAKWLRDKPGLDRECFHVDVEVENVVRASETLTQYFQRDTGDEAK